MVNSTVRVSEGSAVPPALHYCLDWSRLNQPASFDLILDQDNLKSTMSPAKPPKTSCKSMEPALGSKYAKADLGAHIKIEEAKKKVRTNLLMNVRNPP